MKTLKDFKNDAAKLNLYDDWDALLASKEVGFIDAVSNYASKQYATYIWQQATDAQKKVDAEHAKMLFHDGFHKTNKQLKYFQSGADNITVDKDSILLSPNAVMPKQ